MSQSVMFLGLIFLAPVETPGAACAPDHAASLLPIPRYVRPPLPAAGTWYPPGCGEAGMKPGAGIMWHTARKVGQPGSPVIHPEVDTMEFRPSDALPEDARARVW
jgi:hypothetical protein